MANKPMKTLTIGETTYEIVDEQARNDIETLKQNYVNILNYKELVVDDDWTKAIETALSELTQGGTIYFPHGTYNHTGIIINKKCQIIGESRYSTILLNVGGGDSITFGKNLERSMFRDIAVFGNCSNESFNSAAAADATKNRGFVFNENSSILTFERVWMRGHAGDFFYGCGVGHINNINIIDCQLEFGRASAITFIQTDAGNQINSINIKDTNISRFKKNGINLWGSAITVSGCAIQACYDNGINIAITSDQKTGYGHSQGINILNNYFEQGYNSFIRVDAWFDVDKDKHAYVHGLRLEGNYGTFGQMETGEAIPNGAACVKISNLAATTTVDCLSGLVYQCNAFSAPTNVSIVDGGRKLSERNYFYISRIGGVSDEDNTLQFNNLGQATILSDIRSGKDGLTPYVKDKHWWIGDTDTGIEIGADYVLTEDDKASIASQVPMVRVAEFPTWVDNVLKMTDTNKTYVLESNGMIHAYMEKTIFYPSGTVTNEQSLTDNTRSEASDGVNHAQNDCVTTEWIDVSTLPKPCIFHLTGIRWGNPSWSTYCSYVGFTSKDKNGVVGKVGYTCTQDNSTDINIKINNSDYSDVTVEILTSNITQIKFSGTYQTVKDSSALGGDTGVGVGSFDTAKVELSYERDAFSETTTDWFNTGHAYNQPTDYEDRIVALERLVTELQNRTTGN